jgi:predicted nucleic-acid-binding Zn-ribbon protein
MTKVARQKVKCIKCGKESEQMIVFSVNFNLGSRESNEKLMKHMQKCPHCGYESQNISLDTK